MTKKRSTISRRSAASSWYNSWTVYIVLAAYRITSAVNLHPGYLHPDELFQSVEIAASVSYPNVCTFKTWEFQTSGPGPVRSYASIWPLFKIPIELTRTFLPAPLNDTYTSKELVRRILLPMRIFTLFLSFIIDLFILWLSRKISASSPLCHRPPLALLLFSSMAYGGLVWGSRTLSNVWEEIFVCIFCLLSQQVGILSLLLEACVFVWASFIRPSFALFVFPFAILQLYNFIRSSNHLRIFCVHIPLSAAAAVLVGLMLVYLDTQHFAPHANISQPTSWVVTPLRFLRYNSAKEKLAEHGLHPWYAYFFIHWPLMVTPPVMVAAFWPHFRQKAPTLKYACWTSLILATTVFSIIPHKEGRFLLPLLPIALVLGAQNMESYFADGKHSRWFLLLAIQWCAVQALLTIFWDFLHQAGLIPLLSSLESAEATISKAVDVTIFYKTYMPPRFPFGVSSNRSFDFHSCLPFPPHENICPSIIDLAGRPISDLFSLLECIKSRAHDEMILRLVMPGTVASRNLQWYNFGELLLTEKFFPHISTENLPKFSLPRCLAGSSLAECLSKYWAELVSQASLHSYIVRLNTRS
uniref:Mannosyltransferase n=1 Tax=Schistocephalus solidus TaxID=70667 RepID=A0A0X3P8Q1_SCHSO